ncbi:hypothetical protein ON010_g5535 [Phytophthora cinnamomi]|nr:hypothetical protein ON010_g5535 [Phytophthora cinnamomi]
MVDFRHLALCFRIVSPGGFGELEGSGRAGNGAQQRKNIQGYGSQPRSRHDVAEPPHVLDDADGGRYLPGAEPAVRPVAVARRHLLPDEAPGRQGLARQHGGHGGAGRGVPALHLGCDDSLQAPLGGRGAERWHAHPPAHGAARHVHHGLLPVPVPAAAPRVHRAGHEPAAGEEPGRHEEAGGGRRGRLQVAAGRERELQAADGQAAPATGGRGRRGQEEEARRAGQARAGERRPGGQGQGLGRAAQEGRGPGGRGDEASGGPELGIYEAHGREERVGQAARERQGPGGGAQAPARADRQAHGGARLAQDADPGLRLHVRRGQEEGGVR